MNEPNLSIPYLIYADQFYDAFYKVGDLYPSISWPRYFLLSHAIELALKAYLIKVGAAPEELKYEFGHKLDQLVDEAVDKGLPLTTPTQEAIKDLNEIRSRFWHRYPKEDGSIEARVVEQFIPAAHQLITVVRGEIGGVQTST
jgi:HEPN domain-containing protein